MSEQTVSCVLLADRHHGLAEGIRGLLETMFEAVVMVANEPSLQETAVRLQPTIAVVDLALAQGDGIGAVRRLHARCPDLKLVMLTVHDEEETWQMAHEAGANALVLKRAIATDLLPAIEEVLKGHDFVSTGIKEHTPPGV
jgi:two-component system secretion response regulator SsrB